jgi:hypothetical protein
MFPDIMDNIYKDASLENLLTLSKTSREYQAKYDGIFKQHVRLTYTSKGLIQLRTTGNAIIPSLQVHGGAVSQRVLEQTITPLFADMVLILNFEDERPGDDTWLPTQAPHHTAGHPLVS